MVYDYSNIEKLFLSGDIHGEFSTFFNEIKNKLSIKKEEKIENVTPLRIGDSTPLDFDPFTFKPRGGNKNYNDSVFIVAGDCGFGFNKYQYYIDVLTQMNELLKLNNSHIIFVRGNHDDPSYFNENKLEFSNIKLVADYSIIQTKNHCTLCVGGGISIDRVWRKTQESRLNKYSKNKDKRLYWEDEAPVFDKDKLDEIISSGIKIDSVVTHSSPKNMYPQDKPNYKNWLKLDKNLKKDVDNERETLFNLYSFLLENKMDIKLWAYGHFHSQYLDSTKDKIQYLAMSDDYIFHDINNFIITEKDLNPKLTDSILKNIDEIMHLEF